MEVNDYMLVKEPRIFKQMHKIECDDNRMILPSKFIEDYGNLIPVAVRLQLPNGREINVIYDYNGKCLFQLDELVNDFRGAHGVMLVLCYRGQGNFLINIFDHGMTEIEYGEVDDVPRAPVYRQDTVGGVGWKFMSFQTTFIILHGGAIVPDAFVERFQNVIPEHITIVLRNGEVFNGSFLSNDKTIYGLLPIARKGYITVWDVVMFTYSGAAQFELRIFDGMKIEKTLEIIDIVSATESEPESDSSSESGSGSDNGDEAEEGSAAEEAVESDDEAMSVVEDQ